MRQLRAFRSQTVVYVGCNVYTPARDVGQIVSRTAEKDVADKKGGGKGEIRHGKLERIRLVFTDSTGRVCSIREAIVVSGRQKVSYGDRTSFSTAYITHFSKATVSDMV